MKFSYQHGDRPLEGYTVLRGLGQGGFGEVYYAVSDGGREVALKVIQQHHEIELRGVRQCMNLKSPHLVSIFDVKLNDKDVPFVIMEYVGGVSVRDIIQENPEGVGRARAVFLVHEIAKGLHYLHEVGIVHRDLKPENLFFENGIVKIGDYGLSKYINLSRHSGQTMSVGTVHYMAPEIGSGSYTRGIDVYALGIIFYELLTGKVPFDGDSMGEILMKHLSVEPDVKPIDPLLRPILQKALAKKPEERFEDTQALVNAFLEIPEIEEELRGVSPANITSQAPSSPRLGDIPVPTPLTPPGAEPEALPPAKESSYQTEERSRTISVEDEKVEAASAPPWLLNLILGAWTSGAVALALTLLNERPSFAFGALYFLIMLFGGLLASYVHGGTVRSTVIDSWLGQRFVNFFSLGLGVTLTTFFSSLLVSGLVSERQTLLPMILGVTLVDWRPRVDPNRRARFSLAQLVFSALVATIAWLCFRTGNPFTVVGTLTGLSLVANALAPNGKRKNKAPAPPPQVAPGNLVDSRTVFVPPPNAQANREATPVGSSAQSRNSMPRDPGAPREPRPHPRLTLAEDGGVISGVCGGLASHLGWEVVWVRLLFVLAAFLNGLGILAYIIFYFCMPRAPIDSPDSKRSASEDLSRWLAGSARKFLKIARENIALGVGLLVLAASAGVAFGGALMRHEEISWAIVRNLAVPREAVDFCDRALHLPLAMLLFITGVFLTLLARRQGGPMHVFRGLLGWIVCGGFFGYVALRFGEALAVDPTRGSEEFDDSVFLNHFFHVEWLPVPGSQLLFIFTVGCLAVLLLTWPSKLANVAAETPRQEKETLQPFRHDSRNSTRWALAVSLVFLLLLGLFVSAIYLGSYGGSF